MNKRELALLEKAYEAEIEGAIAGGIPVMQTRSKLAAKLVADGLLRETEHTIKAWPFPTTIRGYELTQAGRLLYCANCV